MAQISYKVTRDAEQWTVMRNGEAEGSYVFSS
jgi:hypothetical protein